MLTTSASTCLEHSRNLGPTFYPSPLRQTSPPTPSLLSLCHCHTLLRVLALTPDQTVDRREGGRVDTPLTGKSMSRCRPTESPLIHSSGRRNGDNDSARPTIQVSKIADRRDAAMSAVRIRIHSSGERNALLHKTQTKQNQFLVKLKSDFLFRQHDLCITFTGEYLSPGQCKNGLCNPSPFVRSP